MYDRKTRRIARQRVQKVRHTRIRTQRQMKYDWTVADGIIDDISATEPRAYETIVPFAMYAHAGTKALRDMVFGHNYEHLEWMEAQGPEHVAQILELMG